MKLAIFTWLRHPNRSDIHGQRRVNIEEAGSASSCPHRQGMRMLPADKSHLNKNSPASLRKVLPILVISGCAYSATTSAYCWDEAGARYRISAAVLQSIGQHESGLRATAMNRNQNGTVDVGVMQINSVHFSELQSYGIAPTALWDPCTNVMVGAFLLARSIQKYGNTWEAVGAYHSRTPALKERYAQKVYRVFAGQASSTRGRPALHTTTR